MDDRGCHDGFVLHAVRLLRGQSYRRYAQRQKRTAADGCNWRCHVFAWCRCNGLPHQKHYRMDEPDVLRHRRAGIRICLCRLHQLYPKVAAPPEGARLGARCVSLRLFNGNIHAHFTSVDGSIYHGRRRQLQACLPDPGRCVSDCRYCRRRPGEAPECRIPKNTSGRSRLRKDIHRQKFYFA